MITEDLLPCLQGAVPATIVTSNADGMPNTAIVSQAYPVDDRHIAISNQFFSKTFRNLETNKFASIQVLNPTNGDLWILDLHLERIESEGPLFDDMEMQLEAIASMSGMEDVFKLKSCYVFKILSANRMDEMRS